MLANKTEIAESPSDRIRNRAIELGFDLVGIVPAVSPPGLAHFRAWLDRSFAGEMHYMERQSGAREHPRHVLDVVRSMVMVAMNYRTTEPVAAEPLEGRISRYAWGKDYHRVLRDRLKALGDSLHAELPGCRTRAVVDTAPLLERDFARLAGIGWIGKNTMLINKKLGSWLFLGALLTDAELAYDTAHAADHCGTCTRCLDACPTQAFAAPHQLDSRLCISYLTIELRGPIPLGLRGGVGNWLFGCDVCQEVCPWNRKAPDSGALDFQPSAGTGNADASRIASLTDAELRNEIAGTTLTRAGLAGLRRNAAIVLGNSGSARAIPALERLAQSHDATVRDAAEWAIERITRAKTGRSLVSKEGSDLQDFNFGKGLAD